MSNHKELLELKPADFAQLGVEDCVSSRAFFRRKDIKSIHLPDTVVKIGANAFMGCTSLVQLTLHEGLLEIDAGAFAGCTRLASLNVPASLKTSLKKFGNGVFEACSLLPAVATNGWEVTLTDEDGDFDTFLSDDWTIPAEAFLDQEHIV